MASKEEADKARRERLLNRNTMKEKEEQEKLKREALARIQEGRQQLLHERDIRKEEMRKLLSVETGRLDIQKEKESTLSQIEPPKEAPKSSEVRGIELQYPSLFRSFEKVDSELSAKSAPEVQYKTPKDKRSHTVGDEPRRAGFLGKPLEKTEHEANISVTKEIEKVVDRSVQQEGQLSKTGKSRGFLESVDNEILELDAYLQKLRKGDSKERVSPSKLDVAKTPERLKDSSIPIVEEILGQKEKDRNVDISHSDETVRKEPDTKSEFDYDKFIRKLESQKLRNITSTVQKELKEKPSDKSEYKLKEQVTYRSLQKELDLDSKTKYNVLDMSIESTDTELKQENSKRESLQTREQEIENQEMALTRRQETEERLQKLQKESEAEEIKRRKET